MQSLRQQNILFGGGGVLEYKYVIIYYYVIKYEIIKMHEFLMQQSNYSTNSGRGV